MRLLHRSHASAWEHEVIDPSDCEQRGSASLKNATEAA